MFFVEGGDTQTEEAEELCLPPSNKQSAFSNLSGCPAQISLESLTIDREPSLITAIRPSRDERAASSHRLIIGSSNQTSDSTELTSTAG